MAFVAGIWLLDAPGSALNNRGMAGGQTDNVVEVKKAQAADGVYPYVSAQAVRYWLRNTLALDRDLEWKASPLLREAKVVYTDANPIEWDDDDLFGYMRAPGKSDRARRSRQEGGQSLPTDLEAEVTRISPLRMSPVMALSPTRVTLDFGTASRHVGDPVPYEHEFYRAVLRGLISLDLGSAGTFTYTDRSGFRNLDAVRIRIAEERLLEHLPKERAYRMPLDVRVRRCSTVLQGLGTLMGGAKLATHYTDVTPAALVLAVVKGGNNPFQYTVAAGTREPLRAEPKSLVQAIETWRDQLLSRVYLGWTAGFYDTVHETLLNGLAKAGLTREVVTGHPRRVLGDLAADLASRSGEWLG